MTDRSAELPTHSGAMPSFDAIRLALRSGAWVTPGRVRAYARMVGLLLALAVVALVATSSGGVDWWGRPLGTDFSGVWVAGQAVRAGHPAQPYDNVAHAAAQAAAFGHTDSFLPWSYPPFYLIVAAALAGLPYLAALAVWQGTTIALYLATTMRCVGGALVSRRDALVAALAFPAVTINLLHGQNGCLSTGLLAAGALLLPCRPVAAGACLGLLAYKPQLAFALPVALVAGRHWRAILAAAATTTTMGIVTLVMFGMAPWRAFVQDLGFARSVILEMGGLESFKLQSAFAAARLYGATLPLAYAVQGVTSVGVLCGLAWLWWGAHDRRLKLAGLALATVLVTPYAVDYDMVVFGPALASLVGLFLERGFPPYGKTMLALAWVMPLLARTFAKALDMPLGFVVTLGLFAVVLQQARRLDRGGRGLVGGQ